MHIPYLIIALSELSLLLSGYLENSPGINLRHQHRHNYTCNYKQKPYMYTWGEGESPLTMAIRLTLLSEHQPLTIIQY